MPWIIGGAMLIGGYMSSRSSAKSQRAANDQNLAIHHNQIAWDDYWRRTEVQTRVNDLKAAGLNPMLAAQQGASSPSAPGVQVAPVASPGESLGNAVQSAAQVYAQQRAVKAQVAATEASARKTDAEAAQIEAQLPYSATNAKIQSDMLQRNFVKLGHEVHQIMREEQLKDMDIDELKPLVIEYQRLLNQAERLGLSEQAATAEFFEKVPQAKWAQIIKQLLFGGGSMIPPRRH